MMAGKNAVKPDRRPRSSCAAAIRPVRAAAITTIAAIGALVPVPVAPQAATDASRPVLLTTSGHAIDPDLQQAINQILDAMQQAESYDAALPFATETSNATLWPALQNTNYEFLISILSMRINDLFFRSPEVVAGDAANSRQYFQFFTPDFNYLVKAGLEPAATYQLTGTLGKGTEHLAISAGQIQVGSTETHQYLESGSTLAVNPDGTFTVTIGPTPPSDGVNYIDSSTASSLLIRDMMGNWALGPGSISIACISDCPDAPATGTGLSTDQVILLLGGLTQAIGPVNQMNMDLAAHAGIQLDPNTMSVVEPETFFGVGLPTARISAGNFDLQPDQALIVKVPDVDSAYSGVELMNVFGSALPFTLAQTTLNNTQAYQAADGYTYYVISGANPGVANWLDSGAVGTGEVFARFEGLSEGSDDPTGLAVSTQVVPLADVSQYLPADTPAVSGSEFAADMTARVLSYNYALDTARGMDWVIQHVLLNDIEAAMGRPQFEAVFGTQPFTPMWLRLTPALSPDLFALAKAVVTHPVDSLNAIQDNLALAGKDLYLPIASAAALVQQDVTQTVDAVQAAFSAGDLAQVFQALLSGFQQIGAAFGEAFFDPNTSIIAGILNARDDLATAIFQAAEGFPTQAGALATMEWEYLPDLLQGLSTGS